MLTMACFATTGTVCVMNLRRSPRFSLLLALPLLSVYKASVANSTRKIECRKTLKKRSPFGAEAPQCRRWMRKCLQYHFCDILSNLNEVTQHKKMLWCCEMRQIHWPVVLLRSLTLQPDLCGERCADRWLLVLEEVAADLRAEMAQCDLPAVQPLPRWLSWKNICGRA